MIVGAAKSGTTSLSDTLSQHNDIFISNPKEPKFLTYQFLADKYKGPGDDFTRKKAIKKLEDYLQLFKKAKKNQVRGEASVDSLYYYDSVIPKIKDIIGDPKIIIMLREPASRSFSAYCHLVRDAREHLSFSDALNNEVSRIERGYEFIWAYKGASKYYEAVKAYKENFTNVKVIIFEEFIKDEKKGLDEVLAFLGVDQNIDLRLSQSNVSGKPKSESLNRLLLRDSFLKSVFKLLFPQNLRSTIKSKIQKKNLSPISKPEETISISLDSSSACIEPKFSKGA